MEERGTEEAGIRIVPLAVFALLLLSPLLNLRCEVDPHEKYTPILTFYDMTVKLFAFQTAVTVLWGYLAWQWASGARRVSGAPAWWLFAPLALWVGWGYATSWWSPQPSLAANWVVQGVYGWAGALGLALLLRERGPRQIFVKAASAVVLVLAVCMVVLYGSPKEVFFGERDLLGQHVGAAFLLVPTLMAAAALYGVARHIEGPRALAAKEPAREPPDAGPEGQEGEEADRGYLGVLWLALLVLVLLVAGLRAGHAAWRYALGLGVAVVVWLRLPRWRLAVPVVVVAALVAAVQWEMLRRAKASNPNDQSQPARYARLDAEDWRFWRSGSPLQVLAGRGVGTFFVGYDQYRSIETYALHHGGGLMGHARRQLTEVLVERGILGVVLALMAGGACVAAGAVYRRRARDEVDAGLAAGGAAGAVAMGVFGCFSNGAVGFGASVAFWIAVGLLGSLSAVYRREAGLGRSAEEEAGRAERRPRRRPARSVAALGVVALAVGAWVVLGARPFWADYHLAEGVKEHAWLKAEDLAYARALSKFSPNERRYIAAKRKAADDPRAARELERLRGQFTQRVLTGRLEPFIEREQRVRASMAASATRARRHLSRAAALSLGDRVWLSSQINLLRYLIDRGNVAGATEVAARLDDFCGPIFDLDLTLAEFYVAMGHYDKAHGCFRRYAHRNPVAGIGAFRRFSTDVYTPWCQMVSQQLAAGNPKAPGWAGDVIEAATTGLRVAPRHYVLLWMREAMYYGLGRVEEAYTDSQRALDIIEDDLARRLPEFITARLLIDAAQISLPWDPELAAGLADLAAHRRINYTTSATSHILPRANEIRKRVGLPPLKRRRRAPSPRPGPPARKAAGSPTTPQKAPPRPPSPSAKPASPAPAPPHSAKHAAAER